MEKKTWREELFSFLTGDGDFHSGQELSERLGVSRNAVWKEVNLLREAGFEIESVTNRGYRLLKMPDLMTAPLLERQLPERDRALLHVFEELDSTNTKALQLALAEAPSGTVVLADRQTRGSGRLGRSFASPAGVGIYLSYLIRPEPGAKGLSLLTSYAGLAVSEELEALGLAPQIKWPNDIIIDKRKVCGILTKLTSDAETATVNGAVIGIGINVAEAREDFPEELRDKAISVREAGVSVPRAELAAGVIRRLDEYFFEKDLLNHPDPAILAELERRSCTIGKRVTVIGTLGSREADAIGLAEDGGLRVRYPDGAEATVSSGEVSVRGLLGYAT